MQFTIIAYDGTDTEAIERRMSAREAHLALGGKMKSDGTLLYAAALLNAQDIMAGSMMVVDFPSREALDGWLESEPYVTGKVWQDIQIVPCKISPSFIMSSTPATI